MKFVYAVGRHSGRRILWMSCVVSLIGAHSLLLVCLSGLYSMIPDESVRIRAGCAFWNPALGFSNPGNPPLTDMVACSGIMLLGKETQLSRLEQCDLAAALPDRLSFLARLPLIGFSITILFVSLCWARRLFGESPALCVLFLLCTDPLLIAHGALVSGDIPATAAGVAGMYAFWRWMQQPSLTGAMMCGIALGIALLSKYVWVVMPMLWVMLWTIRRYVPPKPRQCRLPRHLVMMVVLAVYIINLGYAFESTFQPWRTFEFRSPALKKFAVDSIAAPGIAAWPGTVPVPLPEHYLMGIDAVAAHVQKESYPTYAAGRFREGNVWWFHLYGLLVKMPLGTWLLLVIATYARLLRPVEVSTKVGGRAPGHAVSSDSNQELPRWFTNLVLWLPALVILVFVSWVTQIKLLRYVLPALPFMLIWTGHAFVWAQQEGLWRRSLVYGMLGWSVLSSLWVYPHSLSYFNEAAGGTVSGHNHLIWASYDWGQSMRFLKDWVSRNQHARPLYVGCYGVTAPDVVADDARQPPADGPQPGYYAISASVLRGIWRELRPSGSVAREQYSYAYLETFLDETPMDRVGYSIFIYHLDCEQTNAMRLKLGLDLLKCAGEQKP